MQLSFPCNIRHVDLTLKACSLIQRWLEDELTQLTWCVCWKCRPATQATGSPTASSSPNAASTEPQQALPQVSTPQALFLSCQGSHPRAVWTELESSVWDAGFTDRLCKQHGLADGSAHSLWQHRQGLEASPGPGRPSLPRCVLPAGAAGQCTAGGS